MSLIQPDEVIYRARIAEDDLKDRLGREMLASLGALAADGKPMTGVAVSVRRGPHGGYVIEVRGMPPRRPQLPHLEDMA